MGQVAGKDIENAEDISALVREFYSKVYQDEVLRPMFTEVAKVDLEQHLPKMNQFWGSILLGEQSYQGNPMKIHLELNALKPLNECHYIRWLSLFCSTVDKMFQGSCAERAKDVAQRVSQNIAWTLQRTQAQSSLYPGNAVV